jgi:hypothetical protein
LDRRQRRRYANNGNKTVENRNVKKQRNGKESLRRLKPTAGCNASKRRRKIFHQVGIIYKIICYVLMFCITKQVITLQYSTHAYISNETTGTMLGTFFNKTELSNRIHIH